MADAALLRLPQHERLSLTRQALDAGISHFSVADHVSFHTGLGFDGLLLASMLSTLDDRLEVVDRRVLARAATSGTCGASTCVPC